MGIHLMKAGWHNGQKVMIKQQQNKENISNVNIVNNNNSTFQKFIQILHIDM